jgi:hypothetical protein
MVYPILIRSIVLDYALVHTRFRFQRGESV